MSKIICIKAPAVIRGILRLIYVKANKEDKK